MEETCKIYYCYKATNKINGKIYIGFATNPKTRWRNHKRDAKKGLGYAFAAGIKKYGWDNFEFEVICCGKNKRSMLEYVEPALIEQYHSSVYQNGYNILRRPTLAPCGTSGKANKGRKLSEETKKKMSIARKGWKPSFETKQKMSISQKGHFVTDSAKIKIRAARVGQHPSDETKIKMSEVHKGFHHSEETKKKMSAAHKGWKDRTQKVL
jgi:group I intron endonuclease